MNQIDLKDRVAVITGGAQGIGLATAQRFLHSGAHVQIWDMDADRLESARAELAALGSVAGNVVELTDAATVHARCRRLPRWWPGLPAKTARSALARCST